MAWACHLKLKLWVQIRARIVVDPDNVSPKWLQMGDLEIQNLWVTWICEMKFVIPNWKSHYLDRYTILSICWLVKSILLPFLMVVIFVCQTKTQYPFTWKELFFTELSCVIQWLYFCAASGLVWMEAEMLLNMKSQVVSTCK